MLGFLKRGRYFRFEDAIKTNTFISDPAAKKKLKELIREKNEATARYEALKSAFEYMVNAGPHYGNNNQ
jgi:hypothetical protein